MLLPYFMYIAMSSEVAAIFFWAGQIVTISRLRCCAPAPAGLFALFALLGALVRAHIGIPSIALNPTSFSPKNITCFLAASQFIIFINYISQPLFTFLPVYFFF